MVETRRKDEKETKLRDPQDYEWSPGKLERIVKAKILKEEDTTSLCATFSSNGSMTETYIEPGWRIEDILLAAKVLEEEKTQPCYANEAEMRRVFGLVYDVLRYRNVLNYVLQDVGFWSRNQALKNRERIVWLLLYDMQGRKFSRRGDIVTIKARDKIFKTVGLKDIENALLEVRTHLAASISRLRIAGSALTLDKLLPKHLRTGEGIVWSEGDTIASGWINTSNGSINKIELIKELSKEVGLELCENCEVAELDENTYVFDSFCPKVINVHEKTREKIACSSLVREHRFIFLERSLCLGAAAIALAMRIGRLCGPVVLTHSVAPRHTGYLAELLSNVEGAGRLLAFGTGDRRYEYEEYLKKLGITLQQCRVFSEKYISPPPSVEIDRATVVLATPPSSYIGVKDIVDLVVARGGDTKLLESLTNTDDEFSKTRAVLTEQLTTLKYALTRPNVQFLIYEVHTVLPSETTKMVQQVVDYVNQMATEKYIRECLPKRKALLKEKQGQNTIIKTLTKHSLQSKSSNDEFEEESSITDSSHTEKINQHEESKIPSSTRYDNINVPKSDLFEIQTFDEVYNKDSTQTLEPGCFITVIKRKEIMQFDSLFMIKVAESKGLFGDTDKEQSTSKSTVMQTQPIVQTSHVHRVKRKTSAITCDGLSKPLGSIFRSFRTLQSIGEISRSSNEHETRKTRKSTDERISSALTSIKDKVVSRKYRTISSKVFLPYNKTNTLRQKAIKKRKSDSFDILTISEMDAWDQPSSSNKRYNVVSLKKQEGNDKESQRFLSSTALRKSALIRATQRTSFDSILTEQDKPPPLHILEDQEI
ncbi:putative methyltransferase NSUN7 isoform X3 [Vespula maculifrons]|uniref:Methyltransferase NSUN7 isoform X3 n=1 Tax=Vespula maculifrons TaxID=7453 RepID=A0ABD2CD91_VESMC